MKRFFKLNVFAIATLLFLGVADAWGLGINKNVALKFENGTKATWNSNSNTLSWKRVWNNRNRRWDYTGNLCTLTEWKEADLSKYDKMTIVTSNANGKYRVVLTINGTDYSYALNGNGTKVIDIKTAFKNGNYTPNTFNDVAIKIGGDESEGQVKITSITLHKPLEWDAQGKITFYAPDFNVGANVTKSNTSNTFTYSAQFADISIDFDSDGLSTKDIESVTEIISGSGYYQGFQDKEKKERVDWGEILVTRYNLNDAQSSNINLGRYMICASNNNVNITLNSVTFTRKKYTFDVTKDRLYFEDFEKLSDASFLDGKDAPVEAPNASQQGKYYLYGGRGKILKDPTFNNYYQNLADADEYTKSLSENFLRYTFTDAQRSANERAIKATGEATVGFWVNGQVAVDYELPLERGSMFCIFSNDRFRKADNVTERPRFMFDISCNGWVYSYMPNTNSAGTDIGINYFFYGEKKANSGVTNPLESLFGKKNYANTLDQSQHKFYDDKKWHYVTYVMDKDLTRVKIYLDGVLTGTIDDIRKLPNTDHSECEFSGNNDYKGRTLYLRNIILGGFTPHGLFYDKQYYSDAALAYDDIALYGKALTQQQIQSIIDQKNYAPKEWHYGDSFKEYNESKGGNEDPHNVSGLDINSSFDTKDYLVVNKGETITIPSVPKNYYVRVEYYGKERSTSSTSNNLVYIGSRTDDVEVDPKTADPIVATYKANEAGTYQLNVRNNITIRSIIITPYQYAMLRYGYWDGEENEGIFNALNKNSKYVSFNVKRENGKNYYYNVKQSSDGQTVTEDLGENPALPALSLIIDGKRDNKHNEVYEKISEYLLPVKKDHAYIKFTSTAPHVAHIDEVGNITMTGIAGNTTIIAEIISNNLYNGSEIVDSFEIRIKKDENTFKLKYEQSVGLNQKFPSADSDKDLANITMTAGGWTYNDTYYNIPNQGKVKDRWNVGRVWKGKVKGSQEVLDEFNMYSIGKNPAKSESLGRDDGEFYPGVTLKNNITPWTLPCRGSYIKFEPLKAGIVTMYLLQSGNLDGVEGDENDASKQHSTHVYWRPVYITDETGKVVDFVQTATNGRITYHDNFFVGDKRRAQFIEGISETYNEYLREDLLKLKSTDADKFHTLIDNWNNAAWKQKVIPTGDGGYMVMSTAMVRYTFNVYPGKSYYLFSNESQLGFAGFNFEEGRLLDTKTQYYETAPVREVKTGHELHFTDVLNEQQPDIPTGGDDITHVTYERNFAQDKWSSICLPFSMNNRQMREQFGEETTVVLLNNIHDDGKIDLIWHVNQDIIAGYPYFILPRGAVKHSNVANSTIKKITVDTYFNSEIQKENPLFSVGSNGETFLWQGSYNGDCYKSEYPYVFEGNFHNELLPAGSYVMSNNGNLSKLKNATTAKPFRAYLKYQGSDPNNAKPLYTSISWQGEETTTSIDDIIFQNGILTEASDVYGIDGTVVRHDAQNLSNLSKGVYIVNGKKFVVK